MNGTDAYTTFFDDIRYNCEISDARDHGIYSMCTMILRLRNLFKWEGGLEPWQEPEPADLLDWIEVKEGQWEHSAHHEYRQLTLAGHEFSPFATAEINDILAGSGLFYGAGYGRALKSIFFVGQISKKEEIHGCPLVVIGQEKVREMAGALAFVQDGTIVVRRDLLRYFFWDQIQELRTTCRSSFHYALDCHNLRTDDKLDQQKLKLQLDHVVDTETDIFIYHEIGEKLEQTLDSLSLKSLIGRFPGSVIEFVARTIKDLLADTHPDGLIAYLIASRRHSGIAFYVSFLDGLREKLFPEIIGRWPLFAADRDWQYIELARQENRQKMLAFAAKIKRIAEQAGSFSDDAVMSMFCDEILTPLGLDLPAGK